MRTLIFNCVFLCLVISCHEKSNLGKEENKSDEQTSSPSSSEKKMDENVQMMKLITHEVVDQEGTGMVASTYLLPEGWSSNDKLYWEYKDPNVPIRYKGVFKNEDGTMFIQSYPDVRASWNTGPSGTGGYRSPSDIVTGIKDLIKQQRPGRQLRYVSQKILSNNKQNGAQLSSQYTSVAQTGVIKIEYEESGQTFEEEFYGQLNVTDMVTPSVMGQMESVIWGASSLYSVKAVKGRLDECRKIAQTIKSSARMTKPFFNRLAQVIQVLSNKVYQQIYQAGQISKIISQTNDQMIANIDASYQQSQKANDRINNNFSDYIRGVDRYGDGDSQVQLPSGYSNAWVNDKGEYILTNTQGWDPGSQFNGNWKQLSKN